VGRKQVDRYVWQLWARQIPSRCTLGGLAWCQPRAAFKSFAAHSDSDVMGRRDGALSEVEGERGERTGREERAVLKLGVGRAVDDSLAVYLR